MSQVNTQQMGRFVAAGTKDNLSDAIGTLAKLNALHILDYDGSEDGFSLGTPEPSSEEVGRALVKARSAASIIDFSGPESAVPTGPVRDSLSKELPNKIDDLLQAQSRIDELDNEISSMSEEQGSLEMVASLGLDIELLSGYDSLASFVGTVTDSPQFSNLEESPMVFNSKSGKHNLVAVFAKNDSSVEVSKSLESAGFESIPLPSGEGSPTERLSEAMKLKNDLVNERESLSEKVQEWVSENGEALACGLEVLERDHDVLTAPTRVAVSDHAFVIDGWLVMSRAEEVMNALKPFCLHTEASQFELVAGGGGHGHSDHDHHQEMPPIAYQERSTSKPMELLTDAVGRPAYGRIDPTIFMMFTYPLFFGMMLGDMAYGLITMGVGWMVIRNSGTNDMLMLGGKFLTYIGLGTLIFGYIYAEFAGWEIFLYDKLTYDDGSYMKDSAGHYMYSENLSPVAFLANLYPFNLDHGYGPVADIGYGITLSFPFHRVGTHLEDLIVLTIYVGFFHILMGLAIGFRDILLYGNGHGGVGLVCAFFEKGTWMALLIGGWMFAYGFLGDNQGWLGAEEAEALMVPGAGIVLVSVVLLMWTLYKYHGVPFPINVGLAPIEAVGMMPTVISYVRLFAVGIVGVKIAETGNEKLFEPLAHILEDMAHASTMDFVSIPLLLLGWLAVQAFAWGLGVFSPNIHAARLHFVEWMRQYYDSSGEEFRPFGLKSKYVEVE